MCEDALRNIQVYPSVDKLSTIPKRVHNSKSSKSKLANRRNNNLSSYTNLVLNKSTIIQKVDCSTIKTDNRKELPRTYKAIYYHI